jgi:uncharacterized protein YbcC (UPF0753/DUF2309 family)
MHTPLRLSVFIEAPRPSIDRVLAKHAKVNEIVTHEWIHLFQLDTAARAVFARRNGMWVPADGAGIRGDSRVEPSSSE